MDKGPRLPLKRSTGCGSEAEALGSVFVVPLRAAKLFSTLPNLKNWEEKPPFKSALLLISVLLNPLEQGFSKCALFLYMLD